MEKTNYSIYDQFEEDFWYVDCRRDMLKRMLSKYRHKKDLSILDLGCGTGFNYEVLKRFGTVTNLDHFQEPLDSCRKKGIPNLVRGDAQELQFDDGRYDVVVAVELLEHLPDDNKALGEISRVLKDKGLFIFTTPAHRWLWSTDDVLAEHKRRYSRKELIKKISINFRIRYFGQRYFFLFLPTLAIFLYQKLVRAIIKKNTNSLTITPKFLNNLLNNIMIFENHMISKGFRFPLGIGWIGVVEKKD